jgi:hypothetical protein
VEEKLNFPGQQLVSKHDYRWDNLPSTEKEAVYHEVKDWLALEGVLGDTLAGK